jgi:hypothetical protein
MPVPNPNTLTPTRIPNAVSNVGANNSTPDDQTLRKVYSGDNPSDIVIGTKKYYQYDSSIWRTGLTPGDDGYLNDGISPGSISADAPSRYYNGSKFEWWDEFVIYCSDGGTTGPGNDGLEVYVVSGTQSLCSLVGRLTGITGNSSITEALSTISEQDNLLCVNTHYPDIPILDAVDGYRLNLLMDFGFIPCYPRGGIKAYDISGNVGNYMSFNNSSIWSDKTSNSAGGCLSLNGNYGGTIQNNTLLNNFENSFTINLWIKIKIDSAQDSTILDNKDINNNTGYALSITSAGIFKFEVGVGSGYNGVFTALPIPTNRWINIICRYADNSGNPQLDISLSSTLQGFKYHSRNNTASGYLPNSNTNFNLGMENNQSLNFTGYISLVSIYDGFLSNTVCEKLFNAYRQTTPEPQIGTGYGRYYDYY